MDRETTKIVKRFVSKLKKDFDPESVILFGSRARGDNFKTSDFDFIVVSDKFNGIHFMERFSKMYDYWDEELDLEVICYTPEEFKRKLREYGIVRRAVKEGIKVL